MKTKKSLMGAIVASGLLLFVGAAEVNADVEMYRVYNPNSGEHFYTGKTAERNNLIRRGWQDEGIGWTAPDNGDPVYRMYNQHSGDHHYTTSAREKNMLVNAGWKDEGIGWSSSKEKEAALYRAYNPNAKAGSHNYTTNIAEQQNLLRAGWQDEGIAWYGVAKKTTTPTPPRKADENITTVGGGEGDVPGSYRFLYSNKPFDAIPELPSVPFIEFSADMTLIGPKEDDDYGMQFIIAGNGEGSGQVGLDIGFQFGSAEEFAQNRIAVKTVNFPAGAGVHGEQFYSVNTSAKIEQYQKVPIAVRYYRLKDDDFVITLVNDQMVGAYKTKLTTYNFNILHAQIDDWKGKDASLKLENVKVIKLGKSVIGQGAPTLHMASDPSVRGTSFEMTANTKTRLIQGAY